MKKAFMGLRLKRLREEQRLTQAALAQRLGISLSYLNQLENNQRPLTVQVLLALNTAFGLDLQVFSEDDEARLISDCARRCRMRRSVKPSQQSSFGNSR